MPKVSFKNRERIKDLIAKTRYFAGHGMLKRASETIQEALMLDKEEPECCAIFAALLMDMGWDKDASVWSERALKKQPTNETGLRIACQSGLHLGEFRRSLILARRLICLKPSDVFAWNDHGLAVTRFGQHPLAETAYRRSLLLGGIGEIPIHNNLGIVYREQAKYDEALEAFDVMKGAESCTSQTFKTIITTHLYMPKFRPQAVQALHKEWVDRWGGRPIRREERPRDPDRKLRVAIVSSDLHRHPVGRNFLPLFKAFDRTKFEFYAYSEASSEDTLTTEYQKGCAAWHRTKTLQDRDVAMLIAEHKCDVVIYLSGHFDANRPLIATYRPAPVQISYLDPGRLDIPGIDYVFVDRKICPRTLAELGERAIHLPRFYQHEPFEGSPPITGLPAMSNRPWVMFGSFNNPAKINGAVTDAWREILTRAPNSRIGFRYKASFEGGWLRQKIISSLGGERNESRIFWGGMEGDHRGHLRGFNDIDVGLDPFAFNGSTTTFESLWMGVPVIALAGDNIMGRYGAGIMTQVGLPNFVHDTVEDYIAHAVSICEDPSQLIGVRAQLRGKVKEKICAPTSRYFERALRAVWKKWCAGEAQGAGAGLSASVDPVSRAA